MAQHMKRASIRHHALPASDPWLGASRASKGGSQGEGEEAGPEGGREGGVSLKSHLVKTDLSARTPCQQEDCILTAEWFSVVYVGETGASGYIGTLQDCAMGGWEVNEKIAFVFPKIVVI